MDQSVFDFLAIFAFLLILITLANLADRKREAAGFGNTLAGLSYASITICYGVVAYLGLTIQDYSFRVAVLEDQDLSQNSAIWASGIWAPAIAAPFFLLPAARKTVAKLIPIDVRSSVHAVAISLSMMPVIMLAINFALGPETPTELDQASQTSAAEALNWILAEYIRTALLTLAGVGLLTRRKWLQVLERLGLVKPRPTEVAIGVVTGLLWVGIALALASVKAEIGWGLNEESAQLGEGEFRLFFQSIPAILTTGPVIAIVEESLFRGALQPRFGLLLTSLLFLVVRGQFFGIYGLTVLIFGLLLGLLRMRFNTTTCVIAHTTYNVISGLIEHFYPHLF